MLICGLKVSQRLVDMLKQYDKTNNYTSTEKIRHGITGYDVVVNFGVHPRNTILLFLCDGIPVNRFQGSDWYNSKIGKKALKSMLCVFPSHLMYASQQLQEDVGLPGTYLPVPVNTRHFYPRPVPRDKDTLYYCPNDEIYMRSLAPEGATILDGSTPYEDMPFIYSRHKRYVRNTTHDANPKMPYEALLCGCDVWWNGRQVTQVPDEMLPQNAIPKWIKYFTEVIK